MNKLIFITFFAIIFICNVYNYSYAEEIQINKIYVNESRDVNLKEAFDNYKKINRYDVIQKNISIDTTEIIIKCEYNKQSLKDLTSEDKKSIKRLGIKLKTYDDAVDALIDYYGKIYLVFIFEHNKRHQETLLTSVRMIPHALTSTEDLMSRLVFAQYKEIINVFENKHFMEKILFLDIFKHYAETEDGKASGVIAQHSLEIEKKVLDTIDKNILNIVGYYGYYNWQANEFIIAHISSVAPSSINMSVRKIRKNPYPVNFKDQKTGETKTSYKVDEFVTFHDTVLFSSDRGYQNYPQTGGFHTTNVYLSTYINRDSIGLVQLQIPEDMSDINLGIDGQVFGTLNKMEQNTIIYGKPNSQSITLPSAWCDFSISDEDFIATQAQLYQRPKFYNIHDLMLLNNEHFLESAVMAILENRMSPLTWSGFADIAGKFGFDKKNSNHVSYVHIWFMKKLAPIALGFRDAIRTSGLVYNEYLSKDPKTENIVIVQNFRENLKVIIEDNTFGLNIQSYEKFNNLYSDLLKSNPNENSQINSDIASRFRREITEYESIFIHEFRVPISGNQARAAYQLLELSKLVPRPNEVTPNLKLTDVLHSQYSSDFGYTLADTLLNATWKQVKANVSEAQYKQILQEQRQWASKGRDEAASGYSASMSDVEAFISAMQDRTAVLTKVIAVDPSQGNFGNKNGEFSSKLQDYIISIDGSAFAGQNTCGIEGKGTVGKGWIAIKADYASTFYILFTRTGAQIAYTEDQGCGVGVSFDGSYTKK